MLALLIGSTICSSAKPGPRDRYPIKVIKNSMEEGKSFILPGPEGLPKKVDDLTPEVNAGSGECCSRCTYYSGYRR